MSTDVEPRNVTEAIARIMGELPAIGKTRDPNGGVKYAFRGIEAITAEAQELFAKYGVVMYPEATLLETKEIVVNGNPWTDTFLTVRYEVCHGPSDTSKFVTVNGIGRDNNDKGSNKAMTQAYKYALLQILMIADPKDDGDSENHATSGARTTRKARSDVDQSTGEIKGVGMKPREVAAALAKAGLPTGGTVDEMRARLAEHTGGAPQNSASRADEAQPVAEGVPEAPPAGASSAAHVEGMPDFSAMSLKELVAACQAEGLPTTGGKKGMAAALRDKWAEEHGAGPFDAPGHVAADGLPANPEFHVDPEDGEVAEGEVLVCESCGSTTDVHPDPKLSGALACPDCMSF